MNTGLNAIIGRERERGASFNDFIYNTDQRGVININARVLNQNGASNFGMGLKKISGIVTTNVTKCIISADVYSLVLLLPILPNTSFTDSEKAETNDNMSHIFMLTVDMLNDLVLNNQTAIDKE